MGRRIGVLVNPTSGKGRVRKHGAAVLAALASRGDEVVAIQGTDAAQAAAALAARADEGLDTVVAVGGDGTVHLALQAVAGTDIALGIIPLGTGNDAAASVGIPRSLEQATGVVLDGHARAFDVGVARTADGKRRFFLCVLSTGFDSMVNERANRMTRPSGEARYVLAMLAELSRFRALPYRAIIDGVPHEAEAMLVSLGNGPTFGGGMRVCPSADLHDGRLSMLWVDRISRPALLKVFPRIYTGRHTEHPAVTERPVVSVRLDAPHQVAYADGERVGPLPIDVDTLADGVRVLVPR